MLQVLKNLVENAPRYTPKCGRITLGAAQDDWTQLLVSDSGSGIDAEGLPYVFDRLYRADRARGANSGKMGLDLRFAKPWSMPRMVRSHLYRPVKTRARRW